MTIFAVWKHSWKQHAMKLIMELKKQNDLIVQTPPPPGFFFFKEGGSKF